MGPVLLLEAGRGRVVPPRLKGPAANLKGVNAHIHQHVEPEIIVEADDRIILDAGAPARGQDAAIETTDTRLAERAVVPFLEFQAVMALVAVMAFVVLAVIITGAMIVAAETRARNAQKPVRPLLRRNIGDVNETLAVLFAIDEGARDGIPHVDRRRLKSGRLRRG